MPGVTVKPEPTQYDDVVADVAVCGTCDLLVAVTRGSKGWWTSGHAPTKRCLSADEPMRPAPHPVVAAFRVGGVQAAFDVWEAGRKDGRW